MSEMNLEETCDCGVEEEEANKEKEEEKEEENDGKWCFEVLLHRDQWGFGLNLQMQHNRVRVASFRRVQKDDVGPAEQTQLIRTGDWLVGINGQTITRLQQISECLSSGRLGVFRFVRCCVSAETRLVDSKEEEEENDELSLQQAKLVMKELMAENQSLVQQLQTSRLQNIANAEQLEQLQTQVGLLKNEHSQSVTRKSISVLQNRFSYSKRCKEELDKSLQECRKHTLLEAQETFEQEKQELITRHRKEIKLLKEVHCDKIALMEEHLATNDFVEQEAQMKAHALESLAEQLTMHTQEKHLIQKNVGNCIVCQLLMEVIEQMQTSSDSSRQKSEVNVGNIRNSVEKYLRLRHETKLMLHDNSKSCMTTP